MQSDLLSFIPTQIKLTTQQVPSTPSHTKTKRSRENNNQSTLEECYRTNTTINTNNLPMLDIPENSLKIKRQRFAQAEPTLKRNLSVLEKYARLNKKRKHHDNRVDVFSLYRT